MKNFLPHLGTRLDLSTIFINPVITAVAVTEDDSQAQFDEGGRAIGWEWILNWI
jgi:TldD protein